METLKNYLTQKTTWIGILKIAVALGFFSLAPEMQDQMADYGVKIAEGALALIGVYLVIKDERKKD